MFTVPEGNTCCFLSCLTTDRTLQRTSITFDEPSSEGVFVPCAVLFQINDCDIVTSSVTLLTAGGELATLSMLTGAETSVVSLNH